MLRLVTRMLRPRRRVPNPYRVQTYWITSHQLSIGQLRRLEIEAVIKMTNQHKDK